MDLRSVEDELSRIVPLVYRLGCICKDTDLTYDNKQQLANEYCDKLFYGGPIRVACGGITVAQWKVAVASPGRCVSLFHAPKVDESTQVNTESEVNETVALKKIHWLNIPRWM